MAKRFFDTDLFNKVWFRKLDPKYKSFWIYVLCKCDLAGIWEADFEASEFFIGSKITEKDILTIFKDQLLRIDEKRFIVKDFVEFQNGQNLNPRSPVHKKIIDILEKYRLYDRVSNRVLYTPVVLVGVEVIVEEEVGVIVNKEEKFDFKNEMLKLGFDENLTNEWLIVRKSKKATNSKTALNGFVTQVDLTGMDKNEVLKICVERSWSGLKAEWIKKDSGTQLGKMDTFLNNYEIAKNL